MIRINQLQMPLGHSRQALCKKAAKVLGLSERDIEELRIVKQSVDARRKPDVRYSYIVDVTLRKAGGPREEGLVKKLKNRDVLVHRDKPYSLPQPGSLPLSQPPVIIGAGPAGLFCGLALARKGYRPLVLERGEAVEARAARVADFWETGRLHLSSNVQFGEGGAGTFSDGKLNTLVKDSFGRNGEVLRILVEFGADPSILYVSKPHVGTDVLSAIVKNIRGEIERLGGEVRFLTQVTDFVLEGDRLAGVVTESGERIETQALVLAPGHSARDTFERLLERGVPMEAKDFALGLRIQHPQKLINMSQYGMEDCRELGPASYKVTKQTRGGRGVYSFCMCPGGYVVNSSSEPGRLAVNGMSYHDRGGENANSALIVTVTRGDFPRTEAGREALAGILLQRNLEERAYCLGNGNIPIQLYGDFRESRASTGFGEVGPAFKGQYAFANLRELLPEGISQALLEGMESFGGMIAGFDRPDAILAGIESRTSSPVRIPRDGRMESPVRGLFPCGEGAGYAGGITSAAMDGLKAAEEIIRRFAPF